MIDENSGKQSQSSADLPTKDRTTRTVLTTNLTKSDVLFWIAVTTLVFVVWGLFFGYLSLAVKPKDVLVEVKALSQQLDQQKEQVERLRQDLNDRTEDRVYRSEVLKLLQVNADKLVIPDELKVTESK